MSGIIFDDSFVEESVFYCAADCEKCGEPDRIRTFHAERDALYDTGCGNAREDAFRCFYQKWFLALGLKDIFYNVLAEYPLLNNPQVSIRIKSVYSRKDESSELFKKERVITVLIALQCMHMTQPEFIKAFLRHELMHCSDMIDENFSYDSTVRINSVNETEENLVRERFRILWALYVDMRIQQKGLTPLWPMEKYAKEANDTFRSWPEAEINSMLDRMQSGQELKQSDLIRWSTDGRLSKNIGEGGRICPLCGLPSYSNALTKLDGLSETTKGIEKEYPNWRPEMGICPQCFDLLASRMRMGVHG